MQYYTMTTDAGDSAIARAIQSGSMVTFVKMAVGDGGGIYYEPAKTQSVLRNEVWSGTPTVLIDKNNLKRVTATISIPASAGPFVVREVGLFSADGTLMVIAKVPLMEKVSPESGASDDLTVRLYVEVSDAKVVTVVVDPSQINATIKDVEDAKAEVQEGVNAHETDKSNPHQVTAAQIGAAGISTLTTITLPSSGWTGDDAPYRQTVGVEGAKPEPTVIEIQPAGTATAKQWAAWRSALIRGGGQDTDSIILLADGEKPEIDIPMTARIRGDMT